MLLISFQFKDAIVTPEMIMKTPRVCIPESRCPIKRKANSMVNTAHRFMVAATMDTLPISKPLKKNRYPAEYRIAATGSSTTAKAGILKLVEKRNSSAKTEVNPAS